MKIQKWNPIPTHGMLNIYSENNSTTEPHTI